MGLYIHGMKMPKDENDFVKLVIFNDGRCFVAVGEDEVTSKTGIVTARELPPHGDLIDRNALENEGPDVHQDIEYCGYVEDTIYGFSQEMVENAPTIIPAGEGTEVVMTEEQWG